jgi:hypothetical protein
MLEDFSQTYQDIKPDIGETFELYINVRELQRTCDEIGKFFLTILDFRIAKKFKMTIWFKLFVRDWLISSGRNVMNWVKSAEENDKYDRISPTIPYSTSVVDVFTSCQQLLDQVKQLNWPNEIEARMFYFRLFHQILEALLYYIHLVLTSFNNDLLALKTVQKVGPPKSAKIGKIKLKLPTMKKKKIESISNNGMARISSISCIKCLNIQALVSHFNDLCSQLPEIQEENLKLSNDHLFQSDGLYILRLNVIRGVDIRVI